MPQDPLTRLRSEADGGDLDAMAGLGRRLLLGDGAPANPGEGVRCIERAAAGGHAEASSLLARLAAFGVLRDRSLSEAVIHLRRAAELGWEPATQELGLLTRPNNSVDITRLTTAPPARTVSDRPRILAWDGFATPAESDHLIELGRRSLHRALVYRRDAEGHTAAESRTNSECDLAFDHASVLLALMRERIAAAAGIAVEHFEIAKLLHYAPGQEFKPHGDFQETSTPALAREVERRGQRIATFLIYLNDDYEGGETEFPRINLRHRAARGGALLFFKADAAGRPDYDTVHAGRPTTRGEKWLFSQWIRSRPV
jgi:predicted 2-oxoglutarate/Fe(II)-dependent dioxygenase YbiX